jgi:dihydrofolate synthase/folylpolyglutamate synthase
VQVAVLETGMGGRLDSTNVVTPLVSVVTRVDMDHQKFLGDTLEAIAGEKAGILKPGRPAVIGAQELEAETVLRSRADDLACPLCLAPLTVSISGRKSSPEGQTFHLSTASLDVGKVRTPLLGLYQLENIATAVAALEVIGDQLNLPLDADAVKATLSDVRWAARGEMVSMHPPVMVDVAHNPGGAAALAALLGDVFGKRARGTLVLASMRDKDTEKVLRYLAPFAAEIWCVSVHAERSRSPEELAGLAAAAGLTARAMEVPEARQRVAAGEIAGDFVCVTGSVYLAGAWADPGPRDRGEGWDASRNG